MSSKDDTSVAKAVANVNADTDNDEEQINFLS